VYDLCRSRSFSREVLFHGVVGGLVAIGLHGIANEIKVVQADFI